MPGRILGMRRPMFWGAVAVLSLIVLVGLGTRPVRSIMAQSRRKHRAAKQARYREQASQTPEGADRIATSLIMKGNTLDDKGQSAAALPYYREALEIARRFNQKSSAENSQEMMGAAFDHLGMADSAAVYYQKALEIAEVDTIPRNVASTLYNRGVSLLNDPETNDSGLAMLRHALRQATGLRDTLFVHETIYELGIGFLWGFKPDSSISYLRRYVALRHNHLDRKWDAMVHFNIGLAFGQKREWDSAYVHFAKALDADYILRDKTDIWLLQQDIDSVRKWGGIPETPADHDVSKIPRPKGVDMERNLYLMGQRPRFWGR